MPPRLRKVALPLLAVALAPVPLVAQEALRAVAVASDADLDTLLARMTTAEKVGQLVQGDIMRACDGMYTFTPSTADPGWTDVEYSLSIELVVPLPGFVKRRAEVRILNTVKELKARAES